MTRHLLDVDDLSPAELTEVLELALRPLYDKPLAGRGVALVFEKPSNRTRNATEMAVVDLGGHPVSLLADELGLGRRETPEDVARTLGAYHAAIGARVDSHASLVAMADAASVPVFNLLSDMAHPCQALADLLVMRRRWGSVEGKVLAWVGDGNNVAHSLAIVAAMSGMCMRLASPAGHRLDEVSSAVVGAYAGSVVEATSPEEAVTGADAVYTDVWVSMGQEAERETRLKVFEPYRVDAKLMSMAAPGAVFMHCLPAHRGEEVTGDVLEGPASVVWEQVARRRDAARGVLRWLLGARDEPEQARFTGDRSSHGPGAD